MYRFESTSVEMLSVCPPMVEQIDIVWRGYVQDVRPRQLYRYHVQGPYDSWTGHRLILREDCNVRDNDRRI